MADDRPIETPEEAIGRLAKELEDLRTTMAVRVLREPVGEIRQTLRSTPLAGTLFCLGQTVGRATYPALWAWIQEQGLAPAVFGIGDGTTTFALPDLRGRVWIGVGTLAGNAYALGAVGGLATRVMTLEQMPGHDHGVNVVTVGDHDHGGGGTTSGGGGHTGHNSGSRTVASALAGSQDFFFSVANTTQNAVGNHTHTAPGGNPDGGHDHGVDEFVMGGDDPFDIRQPYFAGNYMIWY